MPITNTDPLLGQEVQVTAVESGGFLVRQVAGGLGPPPSQSVETFCANMDAVSAALTLIYTPPPAP